MAKINELSQAQEKILDKLFWLDTENEEDAAEIESLKKDLMKIRGNAEGTLNFLSGLLIEARGILAMREETRRRAERRRNTAKKAVERLSNVVERIMIKFDIKKIALNDCDLRLQMSPGSLDFSPEMQWKLLPDDCFKIEYKPVADAIKAHLDAGEELPGVSIVKKESLRIS